MSDLGLWPLPLLLIANTSRLCLKIANIAQVSPDGACAEWIGLRAAAVLLVGRAEAADEGVEAAPGLSERAGTRGRWVGETEERAWVVVNLSLPELVEVVEEFQHVRAAAKGQGEWGTVVPSKGLQWSQRYQLVIEGLAPLRAQILWTNVQGKFHE